MTKLEELEKQSTELAKEKHSLDSLYKLTRHDTLLPQIQELAEKLDQVWGQIYTLWDAELKRLKAVYSETHDSSCLVAMGGIYSSRDGMWIGAFAEDQPFRFSKAWKAYQQAAEQGNIEAVFQIIEFALKAESYEIACRWLCRYGDKLDLARFAWFAK